MRPLTADPTDFAADRFSLAGRRDALAACLVVLVAALAFFLLNTAQGIGIFTDSTRYMGISARPHDAPLYHWALTAGARLGLSFATAATIVAVITLLANVVLIFAILARAVSGWIVPTLGTALVVLSPQFTTLHSSAMSEPPFLTFLLLTIYASLLYFESGSRKALIAASVFLGLATLTRFAAPPLGAAIALVILASPALDRKRKLTDVALLAGVGGALFIGWMIYSQLTAGRSIGRALWFYGNMGPKEWLSSLEVMTAWILPDQFPLAIRVIVLAAVLWIALSFGFRSLKAYATDAGSGAPSIARVLSAILALFFVFYLLFIVLSVSIEANLTLTGRYAFPAYVMLAMLMALRIADYRATNPATRLGWVVVLGLAVGVCAMHTVRSAARTTEVSRDGYGYQNVSWRTSPTIDAVELLPSRGIIYSNGPDIISYHTGRTAEFSPHEYLLRTGEPEIGNPLSRQIGRLQRIARDHKVYIVMFDRVDWRHYLADENDLVESLNLQQVSATADGRVYRVPPAAAAQPKGLSQ